MPRNKPSRAGLMALSHSQSLKCCVLVIIGVFTYKISFQLCKNNTVKRGRIFKEYSFAEDILPTKWEAFIRVTMQTYPPNHESIYSYHSNCFLLFCYVYITVLVMYSPHASFLLLLGATFHPPFLLAFCSLALAEPLPFVGVGS